jgi:hypothetical protein
MVKSSTRPTIPTIAWDADQQALTWALLIELEKKENFKVLFGKKDPKEVSVSVRRTKADVLFMDVLCHRTLREIQKSRFTSASGRSSFLNSMHSMKTLLVHASRAKPGGTVPF